jgi:FkbM family methyltransferase
MISAVAGIKGRVKRVLNRSGFDFVRYNPRHSLGAYAALKDLSIRSVVDIGANRGDFAASIKGLLPDCSVVMFEPLEDEFRRLHDRFGGRPGFRMYNHAAGDEDGTATFHRSGYSQSSSMRPMAELHKITFPESAEETIETVTVRRLDGLEQELSLAPEVLVKIDVQGFEDKVILGMKSILSKARALIVEVSFLPLYEGQPLFDEINDLLKPLGYRYSGELYQLLSPADGRALQADALYLRY